MNLPSLNGNWVDLIIVAVLLFFVAEAWKVGLWVILSDFFSFFVSMILALKGYGFAADLIQDNFSLTTSVSNALGFLLVAMVSEIILGILLARVILRVPEKLWKHKIGRALSIFPALGEGIIIVSFVLTLIIALPLSPRIKDDVAKSKLGGFLIKQTSGIEKSLKNVFGGVIEDSLTYFTVKPQSNETIPLNVETGVLSEDKEAARQMFDLVNKERQKEGVAPLVWSDQIVPVSLFHARDMWERKYFSHVSPEGDDVGDRLTKHKVHYSLAGENLALAPTVQTAHTGLMNSEGHRANILEKSFKKVGIGVIDNGYWGKMFVQVFTD